MRQVLKYFIFILVFISIGGAVFFHYPVVSQTGSLNNSPIWLSIVRRLTAVPNTFSLRQSLSLIPKAQASAPFDGAPAYIAVDESNGQILAEKNADDSVSIASLTKIMSSLVALDLARPTDEITISQNAPTVVPTKIGVVPGQQMTVAELLHGMLMTSANDAAQAVADGIDAKYGKRIFVDAMNEKARFLGLTETHFANPQGFDDINNKSSAHDLAILSSYALLHYPLIAQIAQKDYIHLPETATHKQFDLYNWNGLLDVYPGANGLKIGNTGDAGYTTVVTANRDGHTILVVVLGAPGILQRDLWASQILDSVFSSDFGLPPANLTVAELEQKYSTWQYWN